LSKGERGFQTRGKKNSHHKTKIPPDGRDFHRIGILSGIMPKCA
jgi:hypothetical protein